MEKDREEVLKLGLMELITQDSGKTIWLKEKGNFISQTEHIMKVISKMINFTVTENMLLLIQV
jgi:hypothetical protein